MTWPTRPGPFARRDTPPEQCACPLLDGPCYRRATGEDRLCDVCREDHHPDDPGRWAQWVTAT